MTAWLLLLVRDGATYGYELRRALDKHRLDVDPATVYRVLRALERDGRVESRWLRPKAGPRRRFYRLTRRGRRTLEELTGLITTARDAHDEFLRAHAQDGDGAADRRAESA